MRFPQVRRVSIIRQGSRSAINRGTGVRSQALNGTAAEFVQPMPQNSRGELSNFRESD
jgi:hypothetical protein